MRTQLGVRHGRVMPNHASGHGLHDDLARTAADNPQRRDAFRRLDELVDETLKASFPASDPPAWTLGGSRHYA